MGNWIPGDPTIVAELLKISSAFTPPPPEGFISPMTWGVESNVVDRFTRAGIPEDRISFQRDTFTFFHPGSPSEYLADFRDFYGPTMNAYEAATAEGRLEELQGELEALFNQHNTSPDDGSTTFAATFLRVTVAR
jgi:hypothetical protein